MRLSLRVSSLEMEYLVDRAIGTRLASARMLG